MSKIIRYKMGSYENIVLRVISNYWFSNFRLYLQHLRRTGRTAEDSDIKRRRRVPPNLSGSKGEWKHVGDGEDGAISLERRAVRIRARKSMVGRFGSMIGNSRRDLRSSPALPLRADLAVASHYERAVPIQGVPAANHTHKLPRFDLRCSVPPCREVDLA